jgi:hypothetical protein
MAPSFEAKNINNEERSHPKCTISNNPSKAFLNSDFERDIILFQNQVNETQNARWVHCHQSNCPEILFSKMKQDAPS